MRLLKIGLFQRKSVCVTIHNVSQIINDGLDHTKAIRIDWHKYYLLRVANDGQIVAMKRFVDSIEHQSHRKKLTVTDYFSKTGFIDVKDIKPMSRALHAIIRDWIDNLNIEDEMEVGRLKIEPPGSILDILTFSIELELHMASKSNYYRTKFLRFTADLLIELQTCFDVLEIPNLELQMISRLIRACKAYYDIGLKQELPIDIVGEFYQATIDIRTSCRSFKQRKEQLNLLLQLLEIIADSLTHWHYDESWSYWCAQFIENDDVHSPLSNFINAMKSGAVLAGSKAWYSFLTSYASKHYPPKNSREKLTLFLIFSCEVEGITAYLNKNKHEIISKYFEPLMKSSEMDLQIPFLFMLESVAAANPEFINLLGELALPFITTHLTKGPTGAALLAESALIALLNNRARTELPNLEKLITPSPLVYSLLQLMTSKVKTIVTQAGRALVCVFSFKPELYTPEIETKISAAFKNVDLKFTQYTMPLFVELASVVNVETAGVTEAFNQTLANYTATIENPDPRALLKMTRFISSLSKPNNALIHELPTVLPILLTVINQNLDAGVENMFDNNDNDEIDEENYQEMQMEGDFLLITEGRITNKVAAFATLANLLNNAPSQAMEPQLYSILTVVLNAIRNVSADEVYVEMRATLTALAKYFLKNQPEQLKQYIELVWTSAHSTENIMTYPDVILNHLIELEKFLAENAPQLLVSIVDISFSIIRQLIEVTIIDENDSVASSNLGYGELTTLFETIIANAPDKRQILEICKPFFMEYEIQIRVPNPELWTIYDMISVVYETCASELIPEDTFGFIKYLWEARTLETRYVSQTVSYTLSFLAKDHPELLPSTKEECIAWVLNGLETPNIREENAGVFDNLLVALVNLISLYKDDKVWLLQFKLFVKYMPPTEDGDTVEGATALRLFNEHVKKAESIGMDLELQADVLRVQKEIENYVAINK